LLSQVAGREYTELLKSCADTNASVHAAERERFLTDHAEVAGRLLRAWKIPERIVSAVTCHHWPAKVREENRALAALIYAGNLMAYRINQGNGVPGYVLSPDEAGLRVIGLQVKDFGAFEEEVLEMLIRERERLG
jgi:HD-like signal output (HDOD) protein